MTLEEFKTIMERYSEGLTDFDAESWFRDPRNFAIGKDDNVCLFEYSRQGVYEGHYFFNSLRGKEAISFCKEVLSKAFQKAEAILGLTPEENKKARWLSRHLGFKSQGLVETKAGFMELFIMTKKEFYNE